MSSLAGSLLVANGHLFDPNFRHTVVLVAQHDAQGALGVVLNRPSDVTVAEVLPQLADLVGPDDPLYIGGPVQPQGAVVLAECDHPDFAALPVLGSIGLLMGELDGAVRAAVSRARVFAGYAGWGPAQLESELERADWIVEQASAEDVFCAEPLALWSSILKRKGGRYALLSLMPFDPSSN